MKPETKRELERGLWVIFMELGLGAYALRMLGVSQEDFWQLANKRRKARVAA